MPHLTHLERELIVGAALSIASAVGSILLAAWMLARLPADYLSAPAHRPPKADGPVWKRVAHAIAKHIAGVLLIAVGVVLSLPGVPGQGVLTILVGVMLLDLPPMRRLERWILARPAILRAVNHLRERRARPPLEPPAPADP